MLRSVQIALYLFSIAAGGASYAQDQPNELVENYLKGVVGGHGSTAFDELMTHSTLDEIKPLEVAALKGRIAQLIELHGPANGYERIESKSYGNSLVRLIYITKHKFVALIWKFYFYHSETEWLLNSFDYSDNPRKLDSWAP